MIPNTITTMTSILNIHKQKRKKQNLKNNRSRAPGYYTQKGIKSQKIIFIGFLASLLTLPYIWFILPPYIDARFYVYTAEVLVVIVEAFMFNRLLDLKIIDSFKVSFIANLCSFLLGLILL